MSQIRAGGHIIGEHGWEPADLAAEPEPSLSMSNTKAELLEAAGDQGDESMTKAELLEVLNGAE